MFRRAKKTTAFLAALLFAALQLHSVLHLLGREDGGAHDAPCAACVDALSQTAVHSPHAAPEIGLVLGFASFQAAMLSLTPQFRGFLPSLRAPPTFS